MSKPEVRDVEPPPPPWRSRAEAAWIGRSRITREQAIARSRALARWLSVRAREAAYDGIAALRDAPAWARALAARTGRLAWSAGGMVGFTALAAAAMCIATFAGDYSVVPMAVAAFVLGIGAAATVGRRSLEEPARLFRVGALVVAALLPSVAAVLCGARLAETHGEEHYAAGWALFGGVTFLGTLVLLPFLEAAPRIALEGSSMGAAFAAALVATGRRGLVRTVLLGALVAGAVAIVPLLDALGPMRLFEAERETIAFRDAATIAAAGATLSFAALLVVASLLATERFEVRRRARSAFAIVSAGIALLFAATILGTTLMPSGWRRLATTPTVLSAPPRDLTIRLAEGAPDTASVVLVYDEATVATRVSVPSGFRVYGVEPRAHHTFDVIVQRNGTADLFAIRIDEHGRRIDDGPLDRIHTHLDVVAGPTFALAALLVVVAFLRARPRARLHRAIRRGTESVLVGKLVSDELAAISIANGVAATAAWRIEAPDAGVIVSLPPKLPVLGTVGVLEEGRTIELVSPEPIRRLGFRDGAAACPPDAVILAGEGVRRDEVVEPWAVAPAGWPLALASVAAVCGTVLALGGSTLLRAELGLNAATEVTTPIPTVAAMEGGSGPAATVPASAIAALEAADASWPERQSRILASPWAHDLRAEGPRLTFVEPLPADLLLDALPVNVLGTDAVLRHAPVGEIADLLGFVEGDEILEVAGVPVTRHTIGTVLRENHGAGYLGVRIRRSGIMATLIFHHDTVH